MVTTVAQLVEDTRQLCYGAVRQTLNRILSTVGSTDTTINLEFDLQEAVRGSIICVEDEMMYVISANSSSKQITVVRGYYGTVSMVHNIGALVEVNPRFPRYTLKRALQQEIDTWSPELFYVAASSISFTSDTSVYDLGLTKFIRLLAVNLSPFLGRTTRPDLFKYQILRDMDPALFPSGTAIEILDHVPTTGIMRVSAALAFDVRTSWTDNTDVEALGLATSMLDIGPYGAAWRLMSAREIPRTNMMAQPEPRLAAEVPPGHITNIASQLKKVRDARIDEERWGLQERYPIRKVA